MAKPLIYINSYWASGAHRMFAQRGYDFVSTPEASDIVVFNGGEDLHPKMYKETIIAHAQVDWLDEKRDEDELKDYERSKGKFKFGICRGGQLLNVMNGGRLWQHVDHHNTAHDMIDKETGETIFTSSVHHQQFILGPEAVVLAEANLANIKVGHIKGRPYNWQRGAGVYANYNSDPEVVFYPKDRALCIQGHPEYGGYGSFTDWCFNQLEKLY